MNSRSILLIVSVGIWIALLAIPGSDPKSQEILEKGFNFGLGIDPRLWYCVLVTIAYAPMPYFFHCWITVMIYMRRNGMHPVGAFWFITAIRQIHHRPEVRASVKMMGLSYLYFFLVCGIWIAYAAVKGF